MSTPTRARFSTRLAERQTKPSNAPATLVSLAPNMRPPKRQKLSVSSSSKSTIKPPVNKRVRGRRGGLKMMHEMPLDIVLEIFSHLDPIDLLHVSRVSKGLRALTQGTGSQLMWKKAYENLGDSAPPIDLPGLNLMFLTSALYGKYCQVCTVRKGQVTLYETRIRLCWDCTVPNLVGFHKVEKDLASLCSNIYVGRRVKHLRYQSCFFKGELDFHRRKIETTKLLPTSQSHQSVWSATLPQRRNYTNRVLQWSRRESTRTNQAHIAILQQRQQDITLRIKAAGYEAEAAHIRIAKMPGVNIRAELTDKGWDKIKGRILAALEYLRQQKIEREMQTWFGIRIRGFRQMVNKAFCDVPKPRIPVPFYEIIHAEPFHDILTSYTAPGTSPLFDEMKEHLRIPELAKRIIEIGDNWKRAADKHLLDLVHPTPSVRTKRVKESSDTGLLELATTFFTCRWCPEALSYPRVLVHSCFRDCRISGNSSSKPTVLDSHDEDADEEDAAEEDDDASNHDEEPEENYGIAKTTPLGVWNNLYIDEGRRWNQSGDEITFDNEACGAAKNILLCIGEDPQTMIASRIQSMDIRVQCMRCSPASSSRRRRSRPFMTWNMAIVHDMQDHFEQPRSAQDWRLVVDKDELAQIKAVEDGKRRPLVKWYQCSFCHGSVQDGKIAQHYTNFHSGQAFDETRQLEYVFEPYDTTMKSHPLPVHL